MGSALSVALLPAARYKVTKLNTVELLSLGIELNSVLTDECLSEMEAMDLFLSCRRGDLERVK
jgi:hypothetical protein